MQIKLTIECKDVSEPSFPHPSGKEYDAEEFLVECARVRMDHGDHNTQVVNEPPVLFEIENKKADTYEKFYFLEWANCYWSKGQNQGRRLRSVTLKFIDDGGKVVRYFNMESAFLASFEEVCSETANDGENAISYRMVIRSNPKTQTIQFLPEEPKVSSPDR